MKFFHNFKFIFIKFKLNLSNKNNYIQNNIQTTFLQQLQIKYQWGSEYQTYELQIHSNSRHVLFQYLNGCPVFDSPFK